MKIKKINKRLDEMKRKLTEIDDHEKLSDPETRAVTAIVKVSVKAIQKIAKQEEKQKEMAIALAVHLANIYDIDWKEFKSHLE